MRYWWVNQNQTYNHEVGGGYLWSPKKNSNGGRNQFYDNMTLVEPGDIVFSFAGTYIRAVGIALSNAVTSEKPKVFGSTGENWSQEGWKVAVEFVKQENPVRPKDHMHLLREHLPAKYSPLQANGDGLQGVYLAEVPFGMAQVLMNLMNAVIPDMPVYTLAGLDFVPEEQEIISLDSLRETEKATLVMSRRGQGIFRDRVKAIEQACRVTGVSAEKFLVASHIKPWKESDNQERIDGNNGLFLSPHVDKLFDSGFITFTAKGKMLVSDLLDPDVLPKWKIDPTGNFGRFNSDQAYFLEHHQLELFRSE